MNPLLKPIAALGVPFYYLGQRAHRWWKMRNRRPGSIPTVVVGNFMVGGTGKTPMVRWVVNQLRDKGWNPVIVSRGYGGSFTTPTSVYPHHTAEQIGDEALLHRAVAPTFIGADRHAVIDLAARWSKKMGHRNPVAVLDDGLQHYALQPHFSMVCQGANDWDAPPILLPLGRFREPVYTRGIDAFISTNAPRKGLTSGEQMAKKSLQNFYRAHSNTQAPSQVNSGLVVCGIAQPNRYIEGVKAVNPALIQATNVFTFGDHHAYTQAEFGSLVAAAKEHGNTIQCTAKDWVKLAPLNRASGSPVTLQKWDYRAQISEGKDALVNSMVSALQKSL